MTSKATTQSLAINTKPRSNETNFDYPSSPNEPGKFDFYRVHLNNQAHKNDSMFSNDYETLDSSVDIPKPCTSFANMKHLSDRPKTSSLLNLFNSTKSSTDSDVSSINNKTPNKQIHTVASFSSLSDAVKKAMQKGSINTTVDQLRRQTNGTTVSSKDLNHLSPQSM